ncbi:MFS transporter [Streptomyces sp. NBC_00893]|uniref:MFS transporter n=1 Tax=Streptomyces sp. NBC_00893 TaxID=2975862 RepID=UPI0022589788|nr:MFS transporter [Streptomyces sp. NBC_00893]MCX4851519.1 MFS transporter [Streptomyces sp. NBC_00893]
MSTQTPRTAPQPTPRTLVPPHDDHAHAPLMPTVVVFALTGLLVSGLMYAVIPLMGGMASDWGVPRNAATWTTTGFGLGYAVGFVLFGPLADRFGPRKVAVIGLLAGVLTSLAMAVAPSLPAALAIRGLEGLAMAAFPPCAFAYIAHHGAPRHRFLMTSCLTTSFLAAAVVGQIVAQFIGDAFGWRTVFLVWAVAILVMAAALHRVMLPDNHTVGQPLRDSYAQIPSLLRAPRLRLLYAAAPVVYGAFVAVYTGIQLAGTIGSASGLLALRAGALPVMVLIPFLTPWLRRVPDLVRLVAALLLAAAAIALIGALTPGTVGLATLLMVFVLGIGSSSPAMIEAVGARAGEAHPTAVSLAMFWFFVGASLGPVVAGAVIGSGLGMLSYVFAAVLIAGALVVHTAWLRERKYR